MKKTLSYFGSITAGAAEIATFLTAQSYAQLALAAILYPLVVFLIFKLLSGNSRKIMTVSITQPVKKPEPVKIQPEQPAAKPEKVDIVDIDKRTFLKLIGAVGTSFFLFSLLGKRAETVLFDRLISSKKIPSPDNWKSDQTEPTPGSTYKIAEIDEDTITFYGFTNPEGAWFIMREDTENGSFRYAKGEANFPANWAKREELRYDYYSSDIS